jgi:hypothetical protein
MFFNDGLSPALRAGSSIHRLLASLVGRIGTTGAWNRHSHENFRATVKIQNSGREGKGIERAVLVGNEMTTEIFIP